MTNSLLPGQKKIYVGTPEDAENFKTLTVVLSCRSNIAVLRYMRYISKLENLDIHRIWRTSSF
jgi:hypothetical protein